VKKRFTEEQIAYALAQESSGQTIAEICRRLGASEQTFYRWKWCAAQFPETHVWGTRSQCTTP
jgi:transposase-like protein